jgi:DNA (cytosine-5)-methyltransferase 1
MTKITGDDLDRAGAIDLLVGGTPCQSFSVAGLRKGLADPRGNLALEFLRLLDRTRARWVVWENVPGVLSSAGGRDFGAFLGALGELGYGWSYRVLDAQYFGVPQRRRRVFVVGHLGDWRRAGAVLLERSSLRGDPAPSREAGAGVAGRLDGGAHGGGFDDNDARAGKCVEVAMPLRAGRQFSDMSDGNSNVVAHSLRADGFDASEDGTGRGTPLVAAPLTANYGKQPDNSDATPPNLVAYQCHGSNVGPMGTVRAGNGNETGGVPFMPVAFSGAFSNQGIEQGMSPTLAGQPMASSTQTGVRRLTPVECARLQGFPDTYLDIPYRGKPACDGPKYKALGNSMAVPVMRWIGERIAAECLVALGKHL